MGSCIRNITAGDLEDVVRNRNMDYAVVKQSKLSSGNMNVFVKVDGKEVSADTDTAWTVDQYRELKKGNPNAVIYDCGVDGVEVVVKYPNGFGVSAISTPRIKSGRHSLEVAIKYGKRVTYDTPIADDFLEKVSLKELSIIMQHVENLMPTGFEYAEGFRPLDKYNKKSILREVLRWYKTGRTLLNK